MATNFERTVLSVKNIQLSDAGIYQITAKNSVAEITKNITVIVLGISQRE